MSSTVDAAYEKIIEKIHSLRKFGSKLGLSRMEKLMLLLGNPQDDLQVIHVAGTNGKGSVCRFIYSVLEENGYKTGLFTSPYLERFTERIEFDGEEISKEDLIKHGNYVFEKVEEMTDEGLSSPTEFEVVTAIGFCYFKSKNADFLVLEVGLGGRGDSTNIVKNPIATVITSISFDHMDYLGNTLVEIAGEKAGILKEGVPLILNVKDEDACKVIKKRAEMLHCPYCSNPIEGYELITKSLENYTFSIGSLKNVEISMVGTHQTENAMCAIKVLQVLENRGKLKLSGDKLLSGLKKAKQTGRFEVLSKNPLTIIDGAHNGAGAESLERVIHETMKDKRLLMIVGILADKKIDAVLDNFENITKNFIATEPYHERKLEANILGDEIRRRGNSCVDFKDPIEAYSYAVSEKFKYDGIIIAGSLYLIGKIRRKIKNEI